MKKVVVAAFIVILLGSCNLKTSSFAEQKPEPASIIITLYENGSIVGQWFAFNVNTSSYNTTVWFDTEDGKSWRISGTYTLEKSYE